MTFSVDELRRLQRYLTPEELAEVDQLLSIDAPLWQPLPGPQTLAQESQADIVGFGGAAGGGKGLALDTPLLTPTGWTTMGAVRDGDWLLDERGVPCRVTGATGVHYRPCYRLRFDDGSSLVADDVHRWVTFDAKELAALTRCDPDWKAARRAKRPSRATGTRSAAFTASLAARNSARAAATEALPPPTGTMRDTATLADTLRTARGRTNHAIPVAGALELPEADLPIPPYTLGAWLGDGTSRNGQLTGIDPEVWQRIEADGFEVRHYAWDAKQHSIIGLAVKLRELGVLQNKHIPAQYLRASYAQRLALLQGLMDTDGHAALDGGCEFDGVREALVDGVLELVRSLGIKATKQKGTARLNGRAISDKFRVKFTTALPVFGLPRKLERLRATTRRTSAFRYLVACEPVDTVPTRCVAVDSPSRQYLAGAAMIPTHNTDLACGKILTQHRRCLVIRREKAQTEGVIQRLTQILGHTDGFNSQKAIWRMALPGRGEVLTEFGGLDNPGDERRWQGRPHDLKIFDEATEMREDQVRFIMGWTRSEDPDVHPQVLLTFNPPTTAEGRWVIDFFAPWLDRKHPNPAKPGELRWFTTVDGKDCEVPDGRPFVLVDGERVYDFDPRQHTPEAILTPKSRTFIPSRLTDNPYYMATGYMATLQALPEPLRSQMLYGDFQAGVEEDPWQVIPTAWVEAAQARWKPKDRVPRMDSLGVDVARGGKDQTVIARRHDNWFDELLCYPGTETPDGPRVAALAAAARRNKAPIHIDVIGVGSSPYDFLNQMGLQVVGVNVAERAGGADKSGRLTFANKRSELWWRMREALDPANNVGLALPPDRELLADLCAPKWGLRGATVVVESREEIYARIKRSPDRASAVLLALLDTPIWDLMGYRPQSAATEPYDPYAKLDR